MAKQTKLTKSDLEKLIMEEIENLDEGFLDRMMSKITATGSGAEASIGNIAKKIANPVRRVLNKDEYKILDPKLVKQMTVLTNRMEKAGKQIAATYNDIFKDYVKLKASMDDAVKESAAEIIDPVLGQAKEASAAMIAVGKTFGDAVKDKAEKGTAKGTEETRGFLDPTGPSPVPAE